MHMQRENKSSHSPVSSPSHPPVSRTAVRGYSGSAAVQAPTRTLRTGYLLTGQLPMLQGMGRTWPLLTASYLTCRMHTGGHHRQCNTVPSIVSIPGSLAHRNTHKDNQLDCSRQLRAGLHAYLCKVANRPHDIAIHGQHACVLHSLITCTCSWREAGAQCCMRGDAARASASALEVPDRPCFAGLASSAATPGRSRAPVRCAAHMRIRIGSRHGTARRGAARHDAAQHGAAPSCPLAYLAICTHGMLVVLAADCVVSMLT